MAAPAHQHTPPPSYAMLGGWCVAWDVCARCRNCVCVSRPFDIVGTAQNHTHGQHCMAGGGGGGKLFLSFAGGHRHLACAMYTEWSCHTSHAHHEDECANYTHGCQAATSRKQDLTGTSWRLRVTHIGVKKLSSEPHLQKQLLAASNSNRQ